MSITVSDCLKLPSLRSARVIAGKRGLGHIVNTASVLEIFEENVFNLEQPVSNSDLLLTSFSTIRDDYELQCRHIENMYNIGDAALIVYYVGIYLDCIHPSLIETADRLGFPLIIMPENRADCLYSEVLSEVYDALLRDKSRGSNLMDSISSLVSRLPENRKNINTLLRLISDNLKVTAVLSDISMNNVSCSKWPVSNQITADDVCRLYDSAAPKGEYFVETEYRGMPVHIFCVPFYAFEYRNFSLYVMDDFAALTLDDVYSIIEILQVFSRLWDMDADNILENALVPAMLEADAQKTYSISARLGIDISAVNTAMIIRPSFQHEDARQQLREKREMLKAVKACSRDMGKEIIIDTYGLYIICFIVYSPAAESDQDYAAEVVSALDEIWTDYTLTLFPCDDNVEDVRKTYLLYTEYIPYAARIFPTKKVMSYGDILFAKYCRSIIAEKGEEYRICRNLLKLLLTGTDAGRELLETLQVFYLDADCEVNTAARLLFIHRNTVQYRLNKIQQTANFRPEDRLDAHLLYTAAACLRLAED